MNRILVSIGPINIYWYSVLIVLAILLAIFLATKESKKMGMASYFDNLLFSVIVFGIIGARLYYVIFNFDAYRNDLLSILKIWEGGLAIYGGIIGGFLAVLYNSVKYERSLIQTTDIIVPSLIIGQAIGRWGNFFNGEAHGYEVSLEFLQKLHLPKFIINGMYIDGVYYHPTFLYESLWCLLGFIILIILRKITNRKKGILTFSYFIWYGLGRSVIEGLRTDSLYIGSLRVSQILSYILIGIGIIGLIIEIVKGRKNNERKV
jgi:phosphatidylglycerol:prolipoprotein diacylglycerol transferase